ncbi:hypothetical protein RJ640_014623 [Escallonia rubra]|uniref:non-specific serine/threonine protein kinase n=1 Tax=Escallonia rubra TaxID=112253 RepID=A0AA88RV39_9ASTE|nr:hypothetical protein RJ640_014623 [Escallonia rubra]
MDVLPSILLFSVLIISFRVPKSCSAADTISFNETFTDGQTLVSSGQSFELGFFSPSGSSSNRYLGIWYKSFPDTPVWVANRESPVSHSYGVLTVSADGNLVLLNNTIPSRVIWSSNSSRTALNSVAQLLDTGNLVLKDSSNMNPDSYIWQSFDFPTDTLLPGMKLGWNLTSGLNLYLTSWKTTSDPSRGDYTYGIEISGLPQGVIRRGSVKTFRFGIWNGLRFSGGFSFPTTLYKSIFVANNDEIYYMFDLGDNSIITKLALPDLDSWHNESRNLEQCKAECLNNCSCMAVANLDIKGRGSGCIMWFGDLMDIRELVEPGSKQDMYIRMPASELASETDKEEIELPMHDLATVTTATSNFSSSNMIGKGGFGSVYKGKLLNGQEIAVKRLSRTSRQGLKEFKNEIILISKLQHRNLVGLLGCCLEGEEKMLVGYMSPEYVVDGNFSEKSDVFSFGVILLEIAWLLWNEDKAIELMDSCLEDSYVESQVLACIQVGLLCVQKLPKDRPEMSSVVFMLGIEGVTLPEPQQPGFFIERSSIEMGNFERCPCSNAGTMTMPEAR